MPMAGIQKTFLYNARGDGFSAQVTRPVQQTIEVQAGLSLPTAGGHGCSRVENYKYSEIFSFDAAYSQVAGSQNLANGNYTTLVAATVEGLNILDMVTADKIVARLSSEHPADGSQPSIIPLGSTFENLRIAGCPVQVNLDIDLFTRLGTFDSFKNEYQTNKQFRETMQQRYFWGPPKSDIPEFLRARYNWFPGDAFPESKGIVLCSLVKGIQTTCPEIKSYGNIIVLPQFGTIYLSDFYLENSSRRLTMLRVEMGSPVCGTASAADVEGNGVLFP
jgi:hypothetical protein